MPNRGAAYSLLEFVDEKSTVDLFPVHGRYSGSSVDLSQRMSNHNNGLKYLLPESKQFNSKLEAAQKSRRKFQYVVIIDGIDEDQQLCFEDAMKHLYECLATEKIWNVNAVHRSTECLTFAWPLEKIIAFGEYLLRKNWEFVEKQVNEIHANFYTQSNPYKP